MGLLLLGDVLGDGHFGCSGHCGVAHLGLLLLGDGHLAYRVVFFEFIHYGSRRVVTWVYCCYGVAIWLIGRSKFI